MNSDFTIRFLILSLILMQLQIWLLLWWFRNLSCRLALYQTALITVQMNQVTELGQLIRIQHNSEEGC